MATEQRRPCDETVATFLRSVRARYFRTSTSSSKSTSTASTSTTASINTSKQRSDVEPETSHSTTNDTTTTKRDHWATKWDEAPIPWRYYICTFEKAYGLNDFERGRILRNNKTYIETASLTDRAKVGSSAIMLAVGGLSRILLRSLNSVHTYNLSTLHNAIEHRPHGIGLVTVSNHQSVLDDPFLLASILPPRILGNVAQMRWGLCSMDICFQSRFVSSVLRLGKALPIQRFGGVNQKFVDDVADKLAHNGWVHIFPEGRVRQKGMGYFKRGIGRILTLTLEKNNHDLTRLPMILPMYHEGMELIMPHKKGTNELESSTPKTGKTAYVYVGEPIDISHVFRQLMPACQATGGTQSDSPECMRLYDEVADVLAVVMRLVRAEARQRVKNDHDVDLGEPFEYS